MVEYVNLEAGKDYNIEIYKNRLDLIPKIDNAYKKVNDYFNQVDKGDRKWNKKICDNKIKVVDDLIIELNKANNIYYHEDKWIYDLIQQIKTNDLTGNALVELIAKEINKYDGVVVRIYNIDNTTVNAEISVVTPYKIYSYYITRGYAKQCKIEKGNTSRTVTKLVRRHIVELLFDEFKEEKQDGFWWYDDFLEKTNKEDK